MHITLHTDYSLRVLIYVALKGNELATIGEIAAHYAISKNHLMKIVQALNSKNYLVALRGKNGGLRLARNPEEINVGALVRETETDLDLVECFKDSANCIIAPACQLKKIFHEALQAFLCVLDQYTLADLLPPQQQSELVRLLGIKTEL